MKTIKTIFFLLISIYASAQSATAPIKPAYIRTHYVEALSTDANLVLKGNGTGLVEISDAYTLPGEDGENGHVLVTNGSGILSFASLAIDPAGSDTHIQFNNAGVFGGSGSLTWNGTTFRANNLTISGGTLSNPSGNTTIEEVVFNGKNISVSGTSAWSLSNTSGNVNLTPASNGIVDVTIGGLRVASPIKGVYVGSTALDKGAGTINAKNGYYVDDTLAIGPSREFNNTTFNLSSNTLTGTTAQFNAALSDGNFATTDDIISVTEIVISSLEILNSFTTPIVLIPAPGPGMFINLIAFSFSIDFNSVAYSGSNPTIRFDGTTQNVVPSTSSFRDFVNSSADSAHKNGPSIVHDAVLNSDLIFLSTGANPTSGDSDIKVKIWYSIESI